MGYPFTYVNNSSQLTSDSVVCNDSCRIYPSRDSISTHIAGQDYGCKPNFSDLVCSIALEDYMLDIEKIKQILKKIENKQNVEFDIATNIMGTENFSTDYVLNLFYDNAKAGLTPGGLYDDTSEIVKYKHQELIRDFLNNNIKQFFEFVLEEEKKNMKEVGEKTIAELEQSLEIKKSAIKGL